VTEQRVGVATEWPYVNSSGSGTPPVKTRGVYRRDDAAQDPFMRSWHREIHRTLHLDGLTPYQAREAISRQTEGLVLCRLVNEIEQRYGDTMIRTEMVGWREATEEEIKWVEWQLAKDQEAAQQKRQREVETFRALHPELEIKQR
jgi:hypothetical protein